MMDFLQRLRLNFILCLENNPSRERDQVENPEVRHDKLNHATAKAQQHNIQQESHFNRQSYHK